MTHEPLTPEQIKAHKFTPLETALIDVLIARHRLEELEWTLERNHHTTMALEHLARQGVVRYRTHNVEGHWYARLTDRAQEAFLARKYASPLHKRLQALEEEVIGLRAALRNCYTDKD